GSAPTRARGRGPPPPARAPTRPVPGAPPRGAEPVPAGGVGRPRRHHLAGRERRVQLGQLLPVAAVHEDHQRGVRPAGGEEMQPLGGIGAVAHLAPGQDAAGPRPPPRVLLPVTPHRRDGTAGPGGPVPLVRSGAPAPRPPPRLAPRTRGYASTRCRQATSPGRSGRVSGPTRPPAHRASARPTPGERLSRRLGHHSARRYGAS